MFLHRVFEQKGRHIVRISYPILEENVVYSARQICNAISSILLLFKRCQIDFLIWYRMFHCMFSVHQFYS